MCIQAGYQPKNGESRMIPIVQSTTFKYDTGEDMGKLFDLEESGYFYTRLANPTNDYVAAKICALEDRQQCSHRQDRQQHSSRYSTLPEWEITLWHHPPYTEEASTFCCDHEENGCGIHICGS